MEARRDFAYEALAEVSGTDMNAGRGELNAALKSIKEQTPEIVDNYLLSCEIHDRAKLYHEVMGEGILLTPSALAKHWKRVSEQQPKPPPYIPPVVDDVTGDAMTCEDCGGQKMVFVGTNATGHDLWAPCPSCNLHANTDFWRTDGTRVRMLDEATVRMRMTQ